MYFSTKHDTDTSQHQKQCQPFTADPDFAGTTVIAAFLALSGLTVLVAIVPVIYNLIRSWRRSKPNFWHWIDDVFTLRLRSPQSYDRPASQTPAELHSTSPELPRMIVDNNSPRQSVLTDLSGPELDKYLPGSDQPTQPPEMLDQMEAARTEPSSRESEPIRNKSVMLARNLLRPLCNAQIFAGITWIAWGFKKWPGISYYHEQFAVNFWWLTLTSVWISQMDIIGSQSKHGFRSNIQRLLILVSVVLACVFQVIVAEREHNHWDPTVPGRCYRSRDGSGQDLGQNLLWIVGTAVYGLAVLLELFAFSRDKFARWISDPLDNVMSKIGRMVHHSYVRTYCQNHTKMSIYRTLLTHTYGAIELICFGSLWLLWWSLVQFLSIWGAGNGSIVIETGAYIIFAATSMYEILVLKLDNAKLIVGQESTVTLGPMVLILMSAGIVYTHYCR